MDDTILESVERHTPTQHDEAVQGTRLSRSESYVCVSAPLPSSSPPAQQVLEERPHQPSNPPTRRLLHPNPPPFVTRADTSTVHDAANLSYKSPRKKPDEIRRAAILLSRRKGEIEAKAEKMAKAETKAEADPSIAGRTVDKQVRKPATKKKRGPPTGAGAWGEAVPPQKKQRSPLSDNFMCKGVSNSGHEWGCGAVFASRWELASHFRFHPIGRRCIESLPEEEMNTLLAQSSDPSRVEISIAEVPEIPAIDIPDIDLLGFLYLHPSFPDNMVVPLAGGPAKNCDLESDSHPQQEQPQRGETVAAPATPPPIYLPRGPTDEESSGQPEDSQDMRRKDGESCDSYAVFKEGIDSAREDELSVGFGASTPKHVGCEGPAPPQPRKPIPRKRHTKSRRGCFNCKRRRIKCNERHPHCNHCIKAGLQCEYPANIIQTNHRAQSSPSPQASKPHTPPLLGPNIPVPGNVPLKTVTLPSLPPLDSLDTSWFETRYPNLLREFIAYFGDNLIDGSGAREWAGYALAHHSLAEIVLQLKDLLWQYANAVEQASNTLKSKRAIRLISETGGLIQRCRHSICLYFSAHAASGQVSTASLSERLQGLGKQISVAKGLGSFEKSGLNSQDSGVPMTDSQDEAKVSEDKTDVSEDDTISQLHDNSGLIEEFFLSNEAFHQLCLNLRCALYFDNTRYMEKARSTVFKKGLTSLARFDVYWNLVDFMRSQYGPNLSSICSVVVLTGSAFYAQATTCGQYLKTIWPKTEGSLIELLDTTLQELNKSPPSKIPVTIEREFTNLDILVEVDSNGLFSFNISSAEKEPCVEIAQQIAWIGSVLSTSPFGEALAYTKPCFTRKSEITFDITFEHTPLHTTEQACWLPLFCGAVIAPGFPIPDRGNEVGLEIPLDLLAAIGGIRHAVEFEGGVVMKGFSHMFVPVRKSGDRIQWHAVTSKDPETRLTYRDGLSHCESRALIHEVSLADLKSCRSIVGWCSVAASRLGSDSVNYENIDYSGAPEADSAIRCAGGSLGFQQFGMASMDFRLGPKDGKCHFQRSGPYQRIVSAAEKTPVALYDTGEERAWLVQASDVMLHILQHRHWLEPFEMNGRPIKLHTNVPPDSNAKEVLLRNRSISLSDCDEYAFQHAILDIWALLEFLIDQNVTRERNANGAAIKPTFSESISGFEFKAVVEERSPFREKQTLLKKTNGGWLQLVRDIDALVLFANGFEDLILPADLQNSSVCLRWQRVPKGQDFLATSSKMLKGLYDVAGCRLSHAYLTSTQLQWHQGNSVISDSCMGSHTCECNPLQQIYTRSAIGTAVPPKQISDHGGVIFGRSGSMAKKLWSKPRTETFRTPSLFSQPNVALTPIVVSTSDYEGSTIPDEEPGGGSGSDTTKNPVSTNVSSCTTVLTLEKSSGSIDRNAQSGLPSSISKKRIRLPETCSEMIKGHGEEYNRSSQFRQKRAKGFQRFVARILEPLHSKGGGIEKCTTERHCE